MRETGIFYRSWFEAAKDLPGEEFKSLFCAIAECAFDDKEEDGELSPVSKAIFQLARPIVKKNKEKWKNRGEVGRTPIPVTKGQVDNMHERTGTVKIASALLGISESTAYRRKRLARSNQLTETKELAEVSKREEMTELTAVKTANVDNVNVNVNLNVNDSDSISANGADPKMASVAATIKSGSDALPTYGKTGQPPASEEEKKAAEAIFNRMPFRKQLEQIRRRLERIPLTASNARSVRNSPALCSLVGFT